MARNDPAKLYSCNTCATGYQELVAFTFSTRTVTCKARIYNNRAMLHHMNELHMIFKPGAPLDHLNFGWDEKNKKQIFQHEC
jgi:hypothetical protein